MNLTEFNQSDHCVHFYCPERSVSPKVYIFLYVCSAAVVLLTVCGNLLIIISVFHFKQLHTPTNMLVLSLAVSDFLIGAFVLPPLFMWSIETCWIFEQNFCAVLLLIASFIADVSVYNVALIAVDRYLALSNPFLYKSMITVRKMWIVVYSKWGVCMIHTLVFCYLNGTIRSSVMCPGECFLFLNVVWSIINLIYSFIFPCSVIIILYSLVFVIAKKHATAIRELNNHTLSKTQRITSHSMKSERKAAKVLGIVVSVFLICLLPLFVYSLLGDVIKSNLETFLQTLIIAHLNSTINPFIYGLFYPWFRKCVKLVITLQIFQKDSELINIVS